jgi:hypothetical protein
MPEFSPALDLATLMLTVVSEEQKTSECQQQQDGNASARECKSQYNHSPQE